MSEQMTRLVDGFKAISAAVFGFIGDIFSNTACQLFIGISFAITVFTILFSVFRKG